MAKYSRFPAFILSKQKNKWVAQGCHPSNLTKPKKHLSLP